MHVHDEFEREFGAGGVYRCNYLELDIRGVSLALLDPWDTCIYKNCTHEQLIQPNMSCVMPNVSHACKLVVNTVCGRIEWLAALHDENGCWHSETKPGLAGHPSWMFSDP
jgi:hypothetical protein